MTRVIIVMLTYLFIVTSAYAGDDNTLFSAIEKNDVNQAMQLIGKGADVNAKDNNGNTPLHWAAKDGQKEVAALLIEKGADVNAKDEDGTPLLIAKKQGNSDLVELLRSKGGTE